MTLGHADAALSRVRVVGRLDAAAATVLGHICDDVLGGKSRRLELDLSAITGSTPDGVNGLARCLSLGRRLPDGVGVTVANDVGRRALLDSMIDV
ncbi:MAG TPA: hypothetical protein VFJ98_05320 [Mycobacteriales bacterium]|nr:hypothetical protein [Mycobacteriales bacterium]